MNNDWKVTLIEKLLRDNKNHNSDKCSVEQLGLVCKELGITGQELLIELSSILMEIYKRSNAFAYKASANLTDKIKVILDGSNQGVVKCTPSEIRQAAFNLGITEEKLCELAIGVMVYQYISSVDLMAQIQQLQAEKEALRVKNYLLEKKVGKVAQPELVKQGVSPAYKPKVSIEQINRLKEAGFSTEEIASSLGVSRATIWRRQKEAEQQSQRASSIW